MIWLLLAALICAGMAVHFWTAIREWVAGALRKANLSRSRLMDAWIRLDSLVTGVRARLYARKRHGEVVMVEEQTLSLDEIDDAEVRAELSRSRTSTRHVMDYVN